MILALFDLDNTLLAGDSDFEWAQFLIDRGVLDRELYEARNREFYEQYKAGTLDIHAFLDFQLKPLSRHPRRVLDAWHAEYMAERILPMIRDAARALVARHDGEERVIIKAAYNYFFEERFEAGLVLEGWEVKSVREGKVQRLEAWLAVRGQSFKTVKKSTFYSDSHNDLPLLGRVTHPVAVDPDAELRAHAGRQGWPVISLG